jgi:hypothetical protein
MMILNSACKEMPHLSNKATSRKSKQVEISFENQQVSGSARKESFQERQHRSIDLKTRNIKIRSSYHFNSTFQSSSNQQQKFLSNLPKQSKPGIAYCKFSLTIDPSIVAVMFSQTSQKKPKTLFRIKNRKLVKEEGRKEKREGFFSHSSKNILGENRVHAQRSRTAFGNSRSNLHKK